MEIFNSKGVLVKYLENNQHFQQGTHQIGLNIEEFSPGFFYIKFQSEDGILVRKLLIK
jgi:hypothetical protein